MLGTLGAFEGALSALKQRPVFLMQETWFLLGKPVVRNLGPKAGGIEAYASHPLVNVTEALWWHIELVDAYRKNVTDELCR